MPQIQEKGKVLIFKKFHNYDNNQKSKKYKFQALILSNKNLRNIA
jgi:hypothetical protein